MSSCTGVILPILFRVSSLALGIHSFLPVPPQQTVWIMENYQQTMSGNQYHNMTTHTYSITLKYSPGLICIISLLPCYRS